MKRILILGASGFVGSNLARKLRDKHRVFGTYASHKTRIDEIVSVPFPLVPGAPISEFVTNLKPDVTIYSAGDSDDRKCSEDPMKALFLHSEAPALIASLVTRGGGRFIYFSSSKIFSGDEGNYLETDGATPKTIYGSAKWQAEELLERYPNVFCLRLGTVYGNGSIHHRSWLNKVVESLNRGDEVPVIHDEFRTFLSTLDLADAIAAILSAPSTSAGTYHLGAPEHTSYYSMAQKIARIFKLDESRIRPFKGSDFSEAVGTSEPRGLDRTMVTSEFEKTFSLTWRTHEASLEALRAELEEGRQ